MKIGEPLLKWEMDFFEATKMSIVIAKIKIIDQRCQNISWKINFWLWVIPRDLVMGYNISMSINIRN